MPRVEKITEKMSKRLGTGTVVILASLEVDALMRRVPESKPVTINARACGAKGLARVGVY